MSLVYLAGAAVFFIICRAFVAFCETMREGGS